MVRLLVPLVLAFGLLAPAAQGRPRRGRGRLPARPLAAERDHVRRDRPARPAHAGLPAAAQRGAADPRRPARELRRRRVLAARRRTRRAGAAARAHARRRGRFGQRGPDRQPRRRLRRVDAGWPLLPRARGLARALRERGAVPARDGLVPRRGAGPPVRLRRLLPVHAGSRRGRALQPPGGGPAQPPGCAAVSPAGRARGARRHRAGDRAGQRRAHPRALRGRGADVVDLYRFDVRRPSILDLRLRTGASNPFNLQLAFTPPTVGRWRVRATYDGTRQAAPSGPAGASLLVAEPLEE